MEYAIILISIAALIAYIFFFGNVTYSVMERNGSNKKRWFLLGALCGIWGPVIAKCIITISKRKNEKWKKCPKCAEEVRAEAKVCRFCGHNFE